jgi:hypothetical protein
MNYYSKIFSVFIILASSILSWHHMAYYADTIPPFYLDEIPNDQTAVSFFKTGVYRSDKFGTAYSAGIATTWPGAVGWLAGGSLFIARLSACFVTWFLSLLLGVWFFRKQNIPILLGLAVSCVLWAVSITTPFAMPYWIGFIYNLGELQLALWIGFSVLLMSRHPAWAVFLLGAVIWLGKIIFAPAAGLFLLGHLVATRNNINGWGKNIAVTILFFFLPLGMWLAVVFLRGGPGALEEWLNQQWGWALHMFPQLLPVAGGAVEQPAARLSIWERFSSPHLEWVNYTTGTKMKNIIIPVGAILVGLAGFIYFWKKPRDLSRQVFWINIMAVLSLIGYSVFHFFFHTHMSQRHFHPALYIGTGLIIFWVTQWLKGVLWIRPALYCAAAGIVAIQLFFCGKHPLLVKGGSYARTCRNLYSAECDPTWYDADGKPLNPTYVFR